MTTTAEDYNKSLAKRLQALKQELPIMSIRQGYKGTGGRSHRRQIFVHFSNDKSIDLWLEDDRVTLGGVTLTRYGQVLYRGRSVDDVFSEIVLALRPLSLM